MFATFNIPMLGRIDNFWVIIAIVIGSVIWDWLKKNGRPENTESLPGESESPRSASGSRPSTTPARPAAAPRPVATSDWEEQLRRLLAGEAPAARPQASTSPPPIRPVIVQEAQPTSPARPVPAPQPVATAVPPALARPRIGAADRAVEVRSPSLTESTTAFQRASHLHENVDEYLKRVEQMTEHHRGRVPTVRRQTFSTESAQTISLIRRPGTARQAVIASMIFGPPKALEGE
jgi:hypothetical protein